MKTITFRPAVAGDIALLHALIERAYRGDAARKGWTHEADLLDGQRTDAAALADLLADPNQRMIVADIEGVLLGCVQIAASDPDIAYLGHLSVEPVGQGRGLGRQLVAAAEALAVSEFNALLMEMTVIKQRSELIAWYSRLGYVPTGEQRPFPMDDARFGLPKTADLAFVVLAKSLRVKNVQGASAPPVSIGTSN